jgi:hypothetical protein
MKKDQAGITKRLVVAMLVIATVGLGALAIRTSTENQNSAVLSLKSIQTDKATLLYADNRPDSVNFVEQVGESRVLAEDLKLVAKKF